MNKNKNPNEWSYQMAEFLELKVPERAKFIKDHLLILHFLRKLSAGTERHPEIYSLLYCPKNITEKE